MSDWDRAKDRAEAETIHSPSGATTSERERLPAVGQHGLATLGLALGLLLVAIQLWLLTIAFDLYLEGERGKTVGVAIASGLVFLGGLGMLRLLDRKPGRRR
jgi:hypothetical protein